MNKNTLFKLVMIAWLTQWNSPIKASVIVGFDQCQAVDSYSQAQMNAISQLNFYFVHASVGGNMMSGLSSLHTSNPGFYQLTQQSEDSAPPGTTQAGVVYEYNRGNPGWSAKIADFTTDVNNGWNSPKVSVAINKFCYIDQSANVNTYITSMSALETAYPQTRFVYMTLPLTTAEDSDNYLRQQFNTTLRGWVSANNRILYDIADIEAHDPSGIEQTFVYNSTTCQTLYDGYSSDGGHPDTGVGPELIARGFYALGNELAAVPEPASAGILAGIGCLSAVWIIRRR